MEAFSVHARRAGDLHVLDVVGELDIATAPELTDAAAEALAEGAPLVLDLTRCTFLDSSGCRAVGMAGRSGASAGVPVSVVSPPQVRTVRRVVDHVGLSAVMGVHDDLGSALATTATGR